MRPAVMVLLAIASSGCIIETVEHRRDGGASDAGPDASADAMPDAADTGVPDSGIDASPCARCGECELCTADACIPAPDGTTCTGGSCHAGACCTGCWDGTACQDGDTDLVCGAGGAECGSCGCPGATCTDGHCTLPTGVICPRLTWSLGFGAATYSVGIDGSDNIYAVGSTGSPLVELGNGSVMTSGEVIWMASYRRGGEHRWSSVLDHRDADLATDVVVDPSTGDIYVSGSVAGDYDLGGGPATTPLDASHTYVASYDASGGYRWSHVSDSPSRPDYRLLLHGGVLYAAAAFGGTVDIGCGPTEATSPSVFLARFRPDTGSCDRIQVYGSGTGIPAVGDLARSETGFFIVGNVFGRLRLGAWEVGSDGGNEVFIATIDDAGTVTFAGSYHAAPGGTYDGRATVAAPDSAGWMYFGGTFNGRLSFGFGRELTSSGVDGFVVRWRAGAIGWYRSLGGSGDEQLRGLGATPDGALVTGEFEGTTDFGNGAVTAAGPSDGFVLELGRADGMARWSRPVGGSGADYSYAIAVLADRSLVVGGSYSVGMLFPDAAVLFRLIP